VTGTVSELNGLANTNTLLDASDEDAPYLAATACRGLGSDWYLPAKDELDVLYTNHATIGGFNLSGSYYWSSSETSSTRAWAQRFNDGYQASTPVKLGARPVRCARR
jgi:hypothetical protein